MRKIIRRGLAIIAGELQVALKTETGNIIAIGALLIEARAQLEHGQWLPWLGENFDSSVSTAENYINAARFAAKFPTVGNLKLRPSALYLLGGEKLDSEFFQSKVIKAILREAESKWVTGSRALDIADSMRPKPKPLTEAEIAAREEEMKAREEEIEARYAKEQAEAEAILDGSAPELPAPPEGTVHDVILPPFDQAIKTLSALKTKPLDKFIGTTHTPYTIRAILDFLDHVADAIDKQQKQKAS